MPENPSRAAILEAELRAARARIEALEELLAEQRQIQETLDENHRFREGVIERAAEGVCVCHDAAEPPFVKFTVWNRRMIEITGYSMEEINRRGWYQTLYPDPEVQARARARMERMRAGEDLRRERWEIQCSDGTMRAIAISTSILNAADGSVHVLGLMHDLTGEEELARQRHLARTDDLTSLRNRRGFDEDGGLLFALARRQDQPITLGYLDLMAFKALNDRRGHQEGDRALHSIAAVLQRSVRSTDVVGRIGGDEFGLVLPGTDAAGAKVFFGGLEQRLLELARDQAWEIGFSVGVVTFSGRVPGLREALREADAVMYRAKTCGRSCVTYELSGPGGARA